MNLTEEIKERAISFGAEKCGISIVDRFKDAPKGFHPNDIYKNSKSVVVFLKQMPTDIIMASNPMPYTNAAYSLYSELDKIALELCRFIQTKNHNAVPIPADTPYLYWDEENQRGQGILSLRHAAFNAGLGFLGRNSLLINPELGNMVYIGAVLTDISLTPGPIEKKLKCPPNCRICLDACPNKALDGITVNQKLCREISFYKNERGFDIYDCNSCRKACILRTGMK